MKNDINEILRLCMTYLGKKGYEVIYKMQDIVIIMQMKMDNLMSW